MLVCPRGQGRTKLLAIVKDPASIARYLCGAGEATEAPHRSPKRGPPYWRSRVLRRLALGDEDAGGGEGGVVRRSPLELLTLRPSNRATSFWPRSSITSSVAAQPVGGLEWRYG